jgi:neurofibromin 1
MLSIYAKWKGASYLKTTLQKVVERLMLTSNVVDLELDPARVDSEEELHRNAHQLRIVAKAFIDHICSSTGNMPASFRTICSIVRCTLFRPTKLSQAC